MKRVIDSHFCDIALRRAEGGPVTPATDSPIAPARE